MLAKRFGFGFGIAILLPMLVHYGVSTFSPSPEWSDYHGGSYSAWSYDENLTEEEKKMREEEYRVQEEKYNDHRKRFERNLFFIAVPMGIMAIVIGAFLSVQAIGAGLIFGGIFTLIDGYGWYWTELEDWMRFLSLLIAFVIMVVIGYKKMNDKK